MGQGSNSCLIWVWSTSPRSPNTWVKSVQRQMQILDSKTTQMCRGWFQLKQLLFSSLYLVFQLTPSAEHGLFSPRELGVGCRPLMSAGTQWRSKWIPEMRGISRIHLELPPLFWRVSWRTDFVYPCLPYSLRLGWNGSRHPTIPHRQSRQVGHDVQLLSEEWCRGALGKCVVFDHRKVAVYNFEPSTGLKSQLRSKDFFIYTSNLILEIQREELVVQFDFWGRWPPPTSKFWGVSYSFENEK